MNARRLARRTRSAAGALAHGIADPAVQIGFAWRGKRNLSNPFFVGLLGAMGLTVAGLHQADQGQVNLTLAFALAPVDTWAGKIAVVAVAAVFLVGFLFWNQRRRSASFFRGVLTGTGFILSFDIVLLHWIFGLHHITSTPMDLVLEPLFVLLGLVFLWFGTTREHRYTR